MKTDHDKALAQLSYAVLYLVQLRRGDCWCEVGIGNPMMRGVHSKVCQDVQAFMNTVELETEASFGR